MNTKEACSTTQAELARTASVIVQCTAQELAALKSDVSFCLLGARMMLSMTVFVVIKCVLSWL